MTVDSNMKKVLLRRCLLALIVVSRLVKVHVFCCLLLLVHVPYRGMPSMISAFPRNVNLLLVSLFLFEKRCMVHARIQKVLPEGVKL